jgi:hypothetical protein
MQHMTFKGIADGFVVVGLAKCTLGPVAAVFKGEIWGSGAFLCGAIVVATVLFGEMYFREQ